MNNTKLTFYIFIFLIFTISSCENEPFEGEINSIAQNITDNTTNNQNEEDNNEEDNNEEDNNDENDDNSQDTENELVGIWTRIDSGGTFEERYTFNSNQTGNNYFHDGSYTNSSDFNWSSENNILITTTEDNSFDIMVSYQINSMGQLVLANDSELIYNKTD